MFICLAKLVPIITDSDTIDFSGIAIPSHKVTSKSSHVRTITIDISYSKTDQLGIGRLVSHVRNNSECCIVKELVTWWVALRDHAGYNNNDYLFSKADGIPIITGSQVAVAMKKTVTSLGWKDNKVSAHIRWSNNARSGGSPSVHH